jgi:hypothetical protein
MQRRASNSHIGNRISFSTGPNIPALIILGKDYLFIIGDAAKDITTAGFAGFAEPQPLGPFTTDELNESIHIKGLNFRYASFITPSNHTHYHLPAFPT